MRGLEQSNITKASSQLTIGDRWDHLLARFAFRRSQHRVEPGLYRLGEPGPDAPVFVSANYTLSFDALRSSLKGIDAHILVLDTAGVNVWCAAGKGTFGTDEIVRRVEETGLRELISHRTLILPQLGAPGVAAHEVKKRSEFRVEFGPIEASDIPEYLRIGRASEKMRRVRFGLVARAILIPVEAIHILIPILAVIILLRLLGAVAHIYNEALAGVLAGLIAVPLLLPWTPTKDFSSKGFIVGSLAALPLAYRQFALGEMWWRGAGTAAGALLITASIASFLALNFTGSTTFTSRTGVHREIYRYIPVIAVSFGIGLGLRIVFALV